MDQMFCAEHHDESQDYKKVNELFIQIDWARCWAIAETLARRAGKGQATTGEDQECKVLDRKTLTYHVDAFGCPIRQGLLSSG